MAELSERAVTILLEIAEEGGSGKVDTKPVAERVAQQELIEAGLARWPKVFMAGIEDDGKRTLYTTNEGDRFALEELRKRQ